MPKIKPIGPWIGIPRERQLLCAIDTCITQGKPQICPADGASHHHGCVHYEVVGQDLYEQHHLKLRHGWGLLCDEHHALVQALFDKRGHKP